MSDPTVFFSLSLAVRVISSVGEAAFFAAAFPLATKVHLLE